MEETQNTPSNIAVSLDLRPAFYPDSLRETAQNAKVVLNFQRKVRHTKDQLRGAYCTFSLPQGTNSPWNEWEPPSIKLIRRKSDEIWELKWGELRDWICELVLCDTMTGKPIDASQEGRVEGFMHYHLYEKDWWWRINRDDVRKNITAHPNHSIKDKDKKPSTASADSEQALRRKIRARYLRGRKPYYEDILENLNVRAADESSSQSSSSSSESSYVSVVSDEPDYIGMLDSGMLPELFASDGDDEDCDGTALPVEQTRTQEDKPYAVALDTTASSESDIEHGSRLVFYAEWRSDHLTALNSHYRSH
ncbi:hypothetical protein B0H65DRAFT_546919 [Neurospora tetraspora]|uniref:Uncharacterized protein n=1 Tax=Neurospora tetraspora TaxID=94610 RepID=A0AAE0JMX0_9PEZI|nr:hypothetical protein B0H65DRAFT_546919 [Neurospora tetraspora]